METIAAISTPYGKGGIAVIRISGEDAVGVASRVFRPASRGTVSLTEAESRKAVYGEIRFPAPEGSADLFGTLLDTGLATVFRAPSSFTGEDTVELSCHGGIFITSQVLAAVLAAGARQALPGEFTRRAFLSGKMGLSAAEALGSLLEAGSGEQARLAQAGMRGVLSEKTRLLYDRLKLVLASVFARIDYPDEDLADLSREEIRQEVWNVRTELARLADTYRTGRAISQGIPTVICGPANAGKSSLYNLLAGRDAAIVTDIAGTTRDVLTEVLSVGRVTLRLSDTAGIRKTEDQVERIGVERALRELEGAGLILAVLDGTVPLGADGEGLLEHLLPAAERGVPILVLLNKQDKCQNAGTAVSDAVSRRLPSAKQIAVSARTGEGLEALVAAIEDLCIDGSLDVSCDAILVSARQHASVLRTLEAVSRGLDALDAGFALDLVCNDLEDAMSALSELDGRQVGEDVIQEIFSRFCVGK